MDASLTRKISAAIIAALAAAALLLWLFWPSGFTDRYSVGGGVSLSYTHYRVEDGRIANEHYEASLAPGDPGLEELGELLGGMRYHRTLLTPFRDRHWNIKGERQLYIIVGEHGGGTAAIELTDGGQLYIGGRKYDMGFFSAEPERSLVQAVISSVEWSPVE